jgi:hypothetical protein
VLCKARLGIAWPKNMLDKAMMYACQGSFDVAIGLPCGRASEIASALDRRCQAAVPLEFLDD